MPPLIYHNRRYISCLFYKNCIKIWGKSNDYQIRVLRIHICYWNSQQYTLPCAIEFIQERFKYNDFCQCFCILMHKHFIFDSSGWSRNYTSRQLQLWNNFRNNNCPNISIRNIFFTSTYQNYTLKTSDNVTFEWFQNNRDVLKSISMAYLRFFAWKNKFRKQMSDWHK